MRVHAIALAGALAFAGPALAQPLPGQAYDAGRDAELANQQMMARQREVSAYNQMMALDAQLRAEQAVRQTEAARVRPILPLADPRAAAAPPSYAAIPDDRLAASRQRVRDAANNRR